MNSDEIKDVLAVRDILVEGGTSAQVISALIAWRDGTVDPYPVAPQQDHSAAEDAVATVEAKAPPKPAKSAAAKAAPVKGRAKPPPPPADDDDSGPSPDPSSDDDADF